MLPHLLFFQAPENNLTKPFRDRIAIRDPDYQAAEIELRNCFSALVTPEIRHAA